MMKSFASILFGLVSTFVTINSVSAAEKELGYVPAYYLPGDNGISPACQDAIDNDAYRLDASMNKVLCNICNKEVCKACKQHKSDQGANMLSYNSSNCLDGQMCGSGTFICQVCHKGCNPTWTPPEFSHDITTAE